MHGHRWHKYGFMHIRRASLSLCAPSSGRGPLPCPGAPGSLLQVSLSTPLTSTDSFDALVNDLEGAWSLVHATGQRVQHFPHVVCMLAMGIAGTVLSLPIQRVKHPADAGGGQRQDQLLRRLYPNILLHHHTMGGKALGRHCLLCCVMQAAAEGPAGVQSAVRACSHDLHGHWLLHTAQRMHTVQVPPGCALLGKAAFGRHTRACCALGRGTLTHCRAHCMW